MPTSPHAYQFTATRDRRPRPAGTGRPGAMDRRRPRYFVLACAPAKVYAWSHPGVLSSPAGRNRPRPSRRTSSRRKMARSRSTTCEESRPTKPPTCFARRTYTAAVHSATSEQRIRACWDSTPYAASRRAAGVNSACCEWPSMPLPTHWTGKHSSATGAIAGKPAARAANGNHRRIRERHCAQLHNIIGAILATRNRPDLRAPREQAR